MADDPSYKLPAPKQRKRKTATDASDSPSNKKKPKLNIVEEEKTGQKVWTAADDFQLKEGIQSRLVFQSMCKSGIWSVRWAASELQSRWREVLYDETISAEAAAHMWSVEAQGRKPRWNDSETKVLEQAKSDSFEDVLHLFEQNRAAWHPTRSLAQVEKRVKELKRAQNREEGGKKSKATASVAEAPVKRERAKRGETAPKVVTPQMALTKYPWNEHVDVLGILVGEKVIFEIRETPATIGRKSVAASASDQDLHVNLSDEGDASTISRAQAVIDVDASYRYTIEQKGKATTSINGKDMRDAGPIVLTPRSNLQFTHIGLTWIPRPS